MDSNTNVLLEYSCFFRSFGLMLVEICLVALYCIQKSVISNLYVNSVMFHVSSVIIIEAHTALFEHNDGAVVGVHVEIWV